MTARLTTGRSLNRVYRQEQRRAEWIAKLYRNARSKLNRLGDLIAVCASSFNPKHRTLSVYWTGTAEDRKRIEKVLGAKIGNGETTVKFSRITVPVVFHTNPAIVNKLRNTVQIDRQRRELKLRKAA